MKRDIYQKLLEWKSSPRRKPLLLKGARQVGKTYILKKFGEQEYAHVAYLNFEEEPLLDDFFKQNLNPEKIISNLSLYLKRDIKPDEPVKVPGLSPAEDAHKARVRDILSAMKRYANAGQAVPGEWVEQLRSLLALLGKT